MAWEPVAAVVAAYMVMVGFVMIAFAIVYWQVGADGTFRQGSYEVNTTWNVLSLVFGLLAAVLGGWTCLAIDKSEWSIRSLIIVIVVLGLLDIAATVKKLQAGTPPRNDGVDNRTAMRNARKPTWVAAANLLVGVAGVSIARQWLG